MKCAGIDFSSHAVDIVKLPLDNGPPEWHRFPLKGADAFDRSRSVSDSVPGRVSVFWEDVVAVGIEDPRGYGAGALYRVQGVILGRIPARTLVHPLIPSQWRKQIGLKGNASKWDTYQFVTEKHQPEWTAFGHDVADGEPDWTEDACDAYCIALATRQLIDTKQAA